MAIIELVDRNVEAKKVDIKKKSEKTPKETTKIAVAEKSKTTSKKK